MQLVWAPLFEEVSRVSDSCRVLAGNNPTSALARATYSFGIQSTICDSRPMLAL